MTGDPLLRGALLVCGTSSGAGKSQVVTGLCRLLARRGVRVAPFKAQNMSLNSFVTASGCEIGRAQAAQAMAAGVEPDAIMNPVLLKPTGESSSQVLVMGRPAGELSAGEYQSSASELRRVVHEALADLRAHYDVVICEGAGGAAEINLLAGDIANLPLAAQAALPVVVVGDIERGGVFAALYGTVALLPEDYRRLVTGFIINKLRGDPSLLLTGVKDLEQRSGVPVLGVVPWLEGLHLDAEDSLDFPSSGYLGRHVASDTIEIAVIRLPHLANFTDFDALSIEPGVELRFVGSRSLGNPDLIIIPGTRATVRDLAWLRQRGIDRAIATAAVSPGGPVILGLCGGYQMLGRTIDDRFESRTGHSDGLGLLGVETVFAAEKTLRQRRGTSLGARVTGYQIHHGRTRRVQGSRGWMALDEGPGVDEEGCRSPDGQVFGTSLHGLFDGDAFRTAFLNEVARRRATTFQATSMNFEAARQSQFDRVADALEAHVDVAAIEQTIARGVL